MEEIINVCVGVGVFIQRTIYIWMKGCLACCMVYDVDNFKTLTVLA